MFYISSRVDVMTSPYFYIGSKGLVINYGEGGLQNGKIAGAKLFAPPPPPQDRVKLFAPPLLDSGNFSRPPTYNMAKLQATA